MYNIMIISEKRNVLKQICGYLADCPDLCLSVVPYSTRTFERYISVKPELVLLDTEASVPYQTLAWQLRQTQWRYRIIFITNGTSDVSDLSSLYIDLRQIDRQLFIDTIYTMLKDETALEQEGPAMLSSWEGHVTLVPYPDAYSIVLVSCVEKNAKPAVGEVVDRLSNLLSTTGGVNVDENGHILCFIRKSLLHEGVTFDDLAKRITTETGGDYAEIYFENVHWKKLRETPAANSLDMRATGILCAAKSPKRGALSAAIIRFRPASSKTRRRRSSTRSFPGRKPP